MIDIKSEPHIKVGLMTGAKTARLTLSGGFILNGGEIVQDGDYTATFDDGAIRIEGPARLRAEMLTLSPINFDNCRFIVHDITIGIDFHWQRNEAQHFQGALLIAQGPGGLTIINELPLEAYLVSVISSEMSATCPAEALRAHAIISRSWLLAQLNKPAEQADQITIQSDRLEIIKWYDRENHADFDVCADDHCQRYQGISKAFSEAAFDAIRDTRGHVLVFEDEICDARYSKSCGGVTEVYSAAWEDKDVPYLAAVYDGETDLHGYDLPLSVEANAERWIESTPPAYCNTDSAEFLARILPGFDQETIDFYRWEAVYKEEELREILLSRAGLDVGRITGLEPQVRGESGRIVKLKIRGERGAVTIGKELEIRRALSRSHLYSSAFVVETEKDEATGIATKFRLRGAGWGHGVGLCQIGAAVMADLGHDHSKILAHYFRGATLKRVYK
ncbi:MAG TPA: SpoIID/LytB domain-containing protein [Blastocatellia bacterium]|nr:SpoIID/LytB domain-containing protein [Blastocatellia bacterium]